MSNLPDCRAAHGPGMQEKARALALSAALATALTTESGGEGHWIAKNGPESLFSIVRKLVPQVPTLNFVKTCFLK
jgi:hypothetical protein